MSVRIQLDKPHSHFTNLDFITGRVIFNIQSDTSISAIVVKLEGESRTRLAGPRTPYNDRPDKKKTELEVHKLLYKVSTVFPTPDLLQQSSSGSSYTLPPGHYEYPFRFKFPFNNACSNNNSMFTNLNLAGMRVEVARDTNRHVKKALPPSVNGFPGEAEIKYYVKVTVIRPQFYKENIRAFADFKFLPIEPPRPPDTRQETFARRQQQFTKNIAQPQKKGLFRMTSTPSTADGDIEPPRFQVDARLPNPPVITCNEPLPLRILVQKLSASSETVFLQMLQMELHGYTHIRAHELTRTESGSWVLTSQSNMNMPLGTGDNPVGKEWKVDPRFWNSIPLPNTVAPSFDTCNISRTYELEVRVGLAHGAPGSIKPELMVLPLRIALKVYSGIKPPAALLEAMQAAPAGHATSQNMNPPFQQGQIPPSTPMTPSYSSFTPQAGMYGPPPLSDDAPPSYEDAMADEIAPVDGPRRDYATPNPAGRTNTGFGDDVKTAGGNRLDSERLFPDSGFGNSSRASSFENYAESPMAPIDQHGSGQVPLEPTRTNTSIGEGGVVPRKPVPGPQPSSPTV